MPATVTVRPWPDPVIDTLGYDPRCAYVETFWLPTLGPTTLLLLRHLATRFDDGAVDLEVAVAATSRALGLGEREGASSPLVRSLGRLVQFDLACSAGPTSFAVRRNVPPVSLRHIRRLPQHLQQEHARWAEAQLAEPIVASARRRARRVALVLLEQGDDPDHAERTLHTTGFHPAVAHEALQWALQRHRDALAAANEASA